MKSVFMSLIVMTMGFSASVWANSLTGTCLLEVNGITYLSSNRCHIDLDEDGSFSIGTDGNSLYFAYANKYDDGMHGFWNANRESHAHDELGILKQEQITEKDGSVKKGACWTNDIAKVCAWR